MAVASNDGHCVASRGCGGGVFQFVIICGVWTIRSSAIAVDARAAAEAHAVAVVMVVLRHYTPSICQ